MIRLFIFYFCALSQLAVAQTEFGFVVGMHAADQRVSYDRSMRISTNGPYTFDVSAIKKFHAGLVANFKLGERIDFKTGLMYSGKGQYERLTRTDGSNGGFHFRDDLNYLQVPMSLVLDFGMQERKGVFLTTGLYFAKALSGKSYFRNYDFPMYSSDKEVVISQTTDNWDAYTLYVKKNDFGLRNGIGYRFGRIMAELTHEIGLVNNIAYINNADPDLLSGVSNENTRKNVTWGFSVTYLPFRIQSNKSEKVQTDETNNQVTWSISAGFTTNKFALSGDKNFVKNAKDIYGGLFGYQIGIGGKIPVKGKLSLKPELNLITRGGSFDSFNEGKVSEKLTYLSVPVLFSVGLKKWNLDLGPTVGFRLLPSKEENGFGYEPVDFGLNGEAGYALTRKLRLYTRYYVGVTTVRKLQFADQLGTTRLNFSNRTLQVSLAYQINREK
jgi:Outer membrane protein beta-barrel domain